MNGPTTNLSYLHWLRMLMSRHSQNENEKTDSYYLSTMYFFWSTEGRYAVVAKSVCLLQLVFHHPVSKEGSINLFQSYSVPSMKSSSLLSTIAMAASSKSNTSSIVTGCCILPKLLLVLLRMLDDDNGGSAGSTTRNCEDVDNEEVMSKFP